MLSFFHFLPVKNVQQKVGPGSSTTLNFGLRRRALKIPLVQAITSVRTKIRIVRMPWFSLDQRAADEKRSNNCFTITAQILTIYHWESGKASPVQMSTRKFSLKVSGLFPYPQLALQANLDFL